MSEESEHKAREMRLRRLAHRQGLQLVRSSTRTPEAYDYGLYLLARDGWIEYGDSNIGCCFDLDDIEEYLRHPATQGVARR